MELYPSRDGLQSTGLSHSSVANRAFQGNFGMPKGNQAKGKSRETVAVNYALQHQGTDNEALPAAFRPWGVCHGEIVRNTYQGISTEYGMLFRVFDKENEAFAKRVGKDCSICTYQKHVIVWRYVVEFIKKKYKWTNMSMNGGLHPWLLPVPAQRGRAGTIIRVCILHTVETHRHRSPLQREDSKKPVCDIPPSLTRWKETSNCPTAILWICTPCQRSRHLLSELVHRVRQVYVMPCWESCTCEKKGKYCWLRWTARGTDLG